MIVIVIVILNTNLRKYQNEKIRITTQLQVKNYNDNTVPSVWGFLFNKFKKFIFTRMFSLNFWDKPLRVSTLSLLSGGALGSYSLQHFKKNSDLIDFPKKLLR